MTRQNAHSANRHRALRMSSLCSSLWGYSTEQDRQDPALLGLPFKGLNRRNKDLRFSVVIRTQNKTNPMRE